MSLDVDMGGGLDLQVPPLQLRDEVGPQGPLDVDGPRVMALDEVAVVAVHAAHEIADSRLGPRCKACRQARRLGRQGEGKVAQLRPSRVTLGGQQV
jgi:hypothetical protein